MFHRFSEFFKEQVTSDEDIFYRVSDESEKVVLEIQLEVYGRWNPFKVTHPGPRPYFPHGGCKRQNTGMKRTNGST